MRSEASEGKDQVKSRIVEVAKRLFAEHGFYETSRTEIRTGASVSEATISIRFEAEELSAKEMILVEILEIEWRRINQLIENLNENGNVIERLRRILSIVLDTFEEDKELRILSIAHSRELYRLGKRIMEGQARKVVQSVESIFVEGQEKGIFRKDLSPKSMQRAFFGTIEEFVHSWVLNETIDYQTEVSRQELEKTIDSMLLGFSIGYHERNLHQSAGEVDNIKEVENFRE